MTAPDDLHRFIRAQDAGDTYRTALAELSAGRKRSHWMWFVFPQIAGLGRSETARFYAIPDLDEAKAYLADPVLGPRLLECCRVLAALDNRDPVEIFGSIDAQKLRSSMTLFGRADPAEPVFSEVLAHYFDGDEDPMTVRLLGA